MQFDFKRLGHFLAVVENGSINSAASSLGISQAGLTKSIRVLETQIGGELFERSRKGMRTTSLGNTMLRHALVLENQRALALAALQAKVTGVEAEVRIGVSMNWVLRLVIPDVLKYFANHPKRPRIKIISGKQSWRMIKDLQNGEMDILLATPTEHDDLTDLKPRYYDADKQQIVVRKGHVLDHDTAVTLADLTSHDWVAGPPETHSHRFVNSVFLTQGFSLRAPVLTIDSSELMLDVISRTNLFGIATKNMISVRHSKVLRTLETPVYQERLTTILTRNNENLPVISEEIIKKIGDGLKKPLAKIEQSGGV